MGVEAPSECKGVGIRLERFENRSFLVLIYDVFLGSITNFSLQYLPKMHKADIDPTDSISSGRDVL